MRALRLEEIAGFVAEGDVLGVNWALEQGRQPIVINPLEWPLPPGLEDGTGPERIGITDELLPIREGIAILRPPSLIVGVNPSPDANPDDLHMLVIDTLAAAGLARSSVGAVVTLDRYAKHSALEALGHRVRGFASEELNAVNVPNPSHELYEALGTTSVCEAAAILSAGTGGKLIVGKRWNGSATVAIARRHQPFEISLDSPTFSGHPDTA